MSVQSNSQNWPFVVNLGNSIIGVAVLAMPFCFKQCGMILGMVVLLFCTWLTLASCQLLVKAGIVSHRRSYEFLAYHTYGAAGKFTVEIGMIGMQFGTLVAQIVVIGDLGPPIVSSLLGFEQSSQTRLYLIVILCLLVGLPLGLMKDLRNVSRASTICISFYAVFTVYVLWLSRSSLWSGQWYSYVNFWRPQGLFQCLPILSFSFGCQTQLFILYDALPEPSLHAIKSIIHSAVNLCAVTYLLVGFFGYITFCQQDIPGDIITVFPSSLATHLIKLGFVMSIAITFPVIIYPCRASIYTLMFQKKSKHGEDMTSTYIPEHLFKAITVGIVLSSMTIGILIPNVEFILGLNGAITGTLICYIFPALFFLRVMSSKAEGKTIAQMVLVLGVSILLISTFTVLYTQDKGHVHKDADPPVTQAPHRIPDKPVNGNIGAGNVEGADDRPKVQDGGAMKEDKGKRVEPPNPDAPGPDIKEKRDADDNPADNKKAADTGDGQNAGQVERPSENEPGGGDKEDANGGKEGGGPALAKQEPEQRQEQLLAALEEQRREQQKLLQEQKELLKELKDHKEQDHEKPKAGAQQQVAQQPAQDMQPPAQGLHQQGGNLPQAGLAGGQQNAALQGGELPPAQQYVGQGVQQQGQQDKLGFMPVQGNVQQQQQQQFVNVPVQGNLQQPVNVPAQGNLQQRGNVPVQGNLPVNVHVQGNLPVNIPVQGNLQQPVDAPVQGNLQKPANFAQQQQQQQLGGALAKGPAVQQNQDIVQPLGQGVVETGGQGVPGQAIDGNMGGGAGQAAAPAGNQNHVAQQQQQQNAAKADVQPQGVVGLQQQAEDQQHAGDKELLRRKREIDKDLPPVNESDLQDVKKEEMRRKLKSTKVQDSGVDDLLNNLHADGDVNSLRQGVAVRSLKAEDGG